MQLSTIISFLINSLLPYRQNGVENNGEFDKLIFDLPKSSLPMLYKSVNLISHDQVELTHGQKFYDSSR